MQTPAPTLAFVLASLALAGVVGLAVRQWRFERAARRELAELWEELAEALEAAYAPEVAAFGDLVEFAAELSEE